MEPIDYIEHVPKARWKLVLRATRLVAIGNLFLARLAAFATGGKEPAFNAPIEIASWPSTLPVLED